MVLEKSFGKIHFPGFSHQHLSQHDVAIGLRKAPTCVSALGVTALCDRVHAATISFRRMMLLARAHDATFSARSIPTLQSDT